MSLADELIKLEQLHERGTLTDEEFQQVKRRLIEGELAPVRSAGVVNRLRRSRSERWIAGVCGGIAQLSGFEPWLWRLLFALLFLFAGSGVLLYLLLWFFVPDESGDD